MLPTAGWSECCRQRGGGSWWYPSSFPPRASCAGVALAGAARSLWRGADHAVVVAPTSCFQFAVQRDAGEVGGWRGSSLARTFQRSVALPPPASRSRRNQPGSVRADPSGVAFVGDEPHVARLTSTERARRRRGHAKMLLRPRERSSDDPQPTRARRVQLGRLAGDACDACFRPIGGVS